MDRWRTDDRVASGGHWCGYVAVPPGHPLHGKDYDAVGADVHGGLTYANQCSGDICHVPAPGEPDDVWWFGFDCAHCWDFRPGHAALMESVGIPTPDWDREEVYRDLAYVRAECESLAEQLVSPSR